MAKEEKVWVQRTYDKPELQKALKAWSNTIKHDGRLAQGWKIRSVHKGGNPPVYDIYLIAPKK
ncbi:hypothetical protein SEA_ALONE_2 [Streptomyces phage Alone3]|nr:hypothetical protein SEA_ALONE_2 [Streptomyces phage Alone3]